VKYAIIFSASQAEMFASLFKSETSTTYLIVGMPFGGTPTCYCCGCCRCLHRGIKILARTTLVAANRIRVSGHLLPSWIFGARIRVRFATELPLWLWVSGSERLWQSAISRYVNFMLTNQFEI